MERINPATGPSLSRIAFGTMRLLEDPAGYDTARVREKIDACLEVGITTFDHADIYGGYRVEEVFGRALKEAPHLREQLEVVTKVGIQLGDRPGNRLKHYDYRSDYIVESVERSLSNLGVDRLDLLLLHRPSPLLAPEEVASAFDALSSAGKVAHFGVSNFATHQVNALGSFTALVCNQVEASVLALDAFENGVLDQCLERRMLAMGWSPLAGGRVFRGDDERQRRVLGTAREIAERIGAALDQVYYAWLLRHPSRMVVVTGTNNMDRIRGAAGSTEVELDSQDWFALWRASTGAEVP